MQGSEQEFYFSLAITGGIALAGVMVSIGLAIVAVSVKNRITLSKAVVLIFNKMKHGKERENGQAKD
jgi:hypothetical protein